MRERRRHVRVRPAPDLPVRVQLLSDVVTVQLDVVDLGINGVGFLHAAPGPPLSVGDEVRLAVELPNAERFEARAIIRHMGSGAREGHGGAELLDLEEEEKKALRECVGELLSRGCSV